MGRAASAFVALLAGCGTSHSPADGGPPDAGAPDAWIAPPTCAERFASEGGACGESDRYCFEGYDTFCAVRALECVDDASVVVEHVWLGGREEPLACANGEWTELAGDGPGGAFVLTGSAASHADGFTSDTKLLFTSGGPVDACETPRLVVDTFRPGGLDRSYVAFGEQPTRGLLTVGDAMHELTGTIIFEREDAEDPGRELEGTLHLEGEGFSVDGPFHVFGCDDLAGTNL